VARTDVFYLNSGLLHNTRAVWLIPGKTFTHPPCLRKKSRISVNRFSMGIYFPIIELFPERIWFNITYLSSGETESLNLSQADVFSLALDATFKYINLFKQTYPTLSIAQTRNVTIQSGALL